MTIGHRRFAVVAVGAAMLAAGGSIAAGTAADAAPRTTTPHAAAPLGVPAGAMAHARTVTQQKSTVRRVARFFATEPGAPHTARAAAAPTLARTPVPVYVLSPEFVRTGTGAVATLSVLATKATAADGRTASVWAAPDPAGDWKVVNIASGADEPRYAAKAGAGTAFREPQLDAWYSIRGDTIRPLNAAARDRIGAGESLANYQRQVHARYASRLPGSRYAKQGLAGGYGPARPASTASAAIEAASWPRWMAPALVGILAALLAAGLLWRRRRAA